MQRKRKTSSVELAAGAAAEAPVHITEISPVKKLRSNHDLAFKKDLCVFCQSQTWRKGTLIEFSTTKAGNTISDSLALCKDSVIKGRLRGVDLRAADAKYHKTCYASFLVKCGSQSTSTDDVAEQSLSKLFNKLRPELEKGRAYSVDDVVKEYRSISPGDTRREFSIIRSLTTCYADDIKVIDISRNEKLLMSQSISLRDVINCAYKAKCEASSNILGDMDKVRIAANILNQDIRSVWKPLENFNITKESVQSIIPDTLKEFMRTLSDGEWNESARASIAQDIIGLSTRKIPPKHVTLASSVKHLTGSKQLVNQLNRMGHCCSDTELQRLYTAAAMTELRAGLETEVIQPPNILPGRIGFIQAAADNDDFLEHTRDGKQTTHGTTMVLYQQQGFINQTYAHPVAKTRNRSLNPAEYQQLLGLRNISHSKKPNPMHIRESRAVRELNQDLLALTPLRDDACALDSAWILARMAPAKLFELDIKPSYQHCPSWSSFNARNNIPDSPATRLSVVGYCPMLNFPSTDPSTIYTVMTNLKKMMENLSQTHSVITFDLALYRIAKEIQWNRPLEFQQTIIRMGGFHIITNYLAALGTMNSSSGLSQLLVESRLFSETTVNQIFNGKHYNRGVLAHKLIYEALSRCKLTAMCDWLISEDREDPLAGVDLSETYSHEVLLTAAKSVNKSMREFDDAMGERHMFRFWTYYLQAVQNLLCFIRAERLGNWPLYLDSLCAMLPVMFAYDRTHYSRWLPIYLADMLNLPDTAQEVYNQFCQGAFTVNRSGKPFAGVPTDQVLEQTLNRDSKTSGGLVGISNNEEARNKWFLTSHIRAHLLSVQKELCSIKSANPSVDHKEDNPAITMKDEADIQSLLSTLEQYEVNPFDEMDLFNLSTGVKPSKQTAEIISQAIPVGANLAKLFIQERLAESNKSFHATISKVNVPQFDHTSDEKSSKKKAAKPKQVPFPKLLILAKSRSVDLHEILEHELGPVPLSMFNENQSMRKTTKSQLMKVLEQKYLATSEAERCHSNMAGKVLVVDAMSLVQTVKSTGNTFTEYARVLFDKVLEMADGYNRVDVVFDVYDHQSIKSAERKRRGDQKMCAIKIRHGNVPVPKNWRSFLSNLQNKNELVRYLCTTWESDLRSNLPNGMVWYVSASSVRRFTKDSYEECPGLKSNHDEADTRLVLHAADALQTHDLVVIRSIDTDVLVIAVHHFPTIVNNETKDLIMHVGMGANQRYISISELLSRMPSNVQSNILPLHALTGCDSTSSFFRVSKKRAVETLELNEFDLTPLGPTDWGTLTPKTYEECERFVAKLYGASFDNVTDARYRLLATKDIKSDAQLPPSKSALKYHILRSAYQVALWRLALTPIIAIPPPTDYGWDQNLVPVLSDPSPSNETLMTSCRCQKSGCMKKTCKCKQQRLPCTDICQCLQCENRAPDEESGSDESEPSDEESDGDQGRLSKKN